MKKNPAKSSVARGHLYEEQAVRFLIKNDYTILERNWRSGRREIDIIARKDDVVAFIEVKAARTSGFGHPVEWVDKRKRVNLFAAAEDYIARSEIKDCDFRFDIIAFYRGKLEHYIDAFRGDD